jgi:hypothetical protein
MITALITLLFLTASFGAVVVVEADKADKHKIKFGFCIWAIFGSAMMSAIAVL